MAVQNAEFGQENLYKMSSKGKNCHKNKQFTQTLRKSLCNSGIAQNRAFHVYYVKNEIETIIQL